VSEVGDVQVVGAGDVGSGVYFLDLRGPFIYVESLTVTTWSGGIRCLYGLGLFSCCRSSLNVLNCCPGAAKCL
jgi:hypothetical protein